MRVAVVKKAVLEVAVVDEVDVADVKEVAWVQGGAK